MKILVLFMATVTCALAQTPSFTSGMFGGVRARSIGPATMSGRVSDIAVVDTNSSRFYVGAAGGGLWKTTNGGTTFKAVFDEYNQSIGAIAIDQRHPDTVWVGTGESWVRNSVSAGDGLYRTTDGGVTWTHLGLATTERISRIVIDPKNPAVVYVAAGGPLWSDGTDRGVYKSTDFGVTWTKILYVNDRTGCADLAMDPSNPSVLIAAMWECYRRPWTFHSGGKGSGLHRSTDGGTTWTRITTGMPEGDLGRAAVAFSPVDPSIVYANIEADSTGFFRSTDNGRSWERRFSGFASNIRPFYFSRIVADPTHKDRIWKTGLNLHRSDDGGTTWSTHAGSAHSDHHAIWVNPADDDHVIMGTDGGVYVSLDRGKTCRFLPNLPLSQFYHVSLDDRRPYNVYGGLQDNGSWTGPSRREGGITNANWELLGGGDGFHVVADGNDPSIVYWESQGGNLNRYDRTSNEARSIKPTPEAGMPDLRWNWNTPIVRPSRRPDVVYTGSQYVHRSTDRGVTWKVISPDLTTNDSTKLRQDEGGGLSLDNSSAENHCTVVAIAESPLDANLIWAGTDDGNLQVTTNGGTTWKNVAANVPSVPRYTWVSYVEPSPHDRRTIFVTLDGHGLGDMRTYVVRSTDLGSTWTMLDTTGVRGWAHVVRQDPVRADLLYLGTEQGLYVSFDRGVSWAAFRNGMPPVAVRDMVIHEREQDLVLATHGRGIYIIDDLDVLRAVTPASITSDLTVLPSKPAVRRVSGSAGSWFNGDDAFIGETVSTDAAVWYYLRDRHMRGKFEILIMDAAGNTIRTVPGSPRRGINKVELPLRRKAPATAASDAGFAGGSFIGPLIAEGTYTVELRKGTDTVRTSMVVVTDTIYKHSPADRQMQQRLVDSLYALNEELAVTVARVRALRDTLSARLADSTLSESLRERLTSVRDTAAAVNNSLVNSKVGFVTGEEQLRERLATLYGEVNGFLGRPSEAQIVLTGVLAKRVTEGTARVEGMVGAEMNLLNQDLRSAMMRVVVIEPRASTYKRLTGR
ncbi:MAG: glycosyl hydrolase [Candidatus Kapabacteria bacterium]|nr:glycosyl hydrolase [Candidatus Kapabacteria bacterium]